MNQRVTDAERVQAIRERADATFAYVLKGSENAATGREVRLAQDIRTLLALLEEAAGVLQILVNGIMLLEPSALPSLHKVSGLRWWDALEKARAFLRYKGEPEK